MPTGMCAKDVTNSQWLGISLACPGHGGTLSLPHAVLLTVGRLHVTISNVLTGKPCIPGPVVSVRQCRPARFDTNTALPSTLSDDTVTLVGRDAGNAKGYERAPVLGGQRTTKRNLTN